LLLGIAYLSIPIVTSQDMFSYIAYARLGAVYRLNPLTALPTSIASDPIYPLLYWTKQPSAYGPVWAIISCSLQWIAWHSGSRRLLAIELLLRGFGLLMHLGSTLLIWLISARLQRRGQRASNLGFQFQRRRAMLAFAWNPFLLFEACVNAHTDVTILFFVLLALWALLPGPSTIVEVATLDPIAWCLQWVWEKRNIIAAAGLLAIATCIKITLVLLFPGLLLFLWTRPLSALYSKDRVQDVMMVICIYVSVVVLLYVPFWQQGAILQLLRVSPVMTADINSLYQVIVGVIAGMRGTTIPTALEPSSRIEIISHIVSTVLFAVAYGVLCIWPLLRPRYVNTLSALIRWMALAELLYCLVGSPWFWPWYTIPLLGLLALIEADGRATICTRFLRRSFPAGTFARLLTISMLSLYTFGTWSSGQSSPSFLHPFLWLYSSRYCPLLPHFPWDDLIGLLAWGPPIAIICGWLLCCLSQYFSASRQ
jgi:hypothetical protein